MKRYIAKLLLLFFSYPVYVYIIMHAVAILTGSGMSCYYSYVYTATYIYIELAQLQLASYYSHYHTGNYSYKLTGNTIGIQLLSGLRTPAVRSHAVRMS